MGSIKYENTFLVFHIPQDEMGTNSLMAQNPLYGELLFVYSEKADSCESAFFILLSCTTRQKPR